MIRVADHSCDAQVGSGGRQVLKLLGAKQLGKSRYSQTSAGTRRRSGRRLHGCRARRRMRRRPTNDSRRAVESRRAVVTRCALPEQIWFRSRAIRMTFGHSLTAPVGFRACVRRWSAAPNWRCRCGRCSRLDWGPAREVRPEQPLLAASEPLACPSDPLVRQVRPDELEIYLPAAIAMFIEEVGVDPRANDGGRGYRHRVASLIAAQSSVGAISRTARWFSRRRSDRCLRRCGQIQGVWVNPDLRGQGFGVTGTAAVAESIMATGRIASLYVNSFNTIARSTYSRVGFRQVATFSTVLLD